MDTQAGKFWFVVATASSSDRALYWRKGDGQGLRSRVRDVYELRAPNTEFPVARRLREAGFDAFCPVDRLRRAVGVRKTRRTVTVENPLLPGYLFVRCDGSALDLRRIRDTKGVDNLLAGAGEDAPRAVPEALLDVLQTKFAPSDPAYEANVFGPDGVGFGGRDQWGKRRQVKLLGWQARPSLRAMTPEQRAADMGLRLGAPAVITGGPFDGLVGVLQDVDASERICILLNIMGAPVPVQVKAGGVSQELTAEPCA